MVDRHYDLHLIESCNPSDFNGHTPEQSRDVYSLSHYTGWSIIQWSTNRNTLLTLSYMSNEKSFYCHMTLYHIPGHGLELTCSNITTRTISYYFTNFVDVHSVYEQCN